MDALTSVFILPLISGYLISIRTTEKLRQHSLRLSGQALFFQCAFIGLILYILSSWLFISVQTITPYLHETLKGFFNQTWDYLYIPWNKVGLKINNNSVFTFYVAIISIIAFEVWIRISPASLKESYKSGLMSEAGGLQLLLFKAMIKFDPVMLNMYSNKIYIGYIFEMKGTVTQKPTVKLWLIASGYRVESTKEIIISKSFLHALEIAKVAASKEKFKEIEIEYEEKKQTLSYDEVQEFGNKYGIVLNISDIQISSYWLGDTLPIAAQKNQPDQATTVKDDCLVSNQVKDYETNIKGKINSLKNISNALNDTLQSIEGEIKK